MPMEQRLDLRDTLAGGGEMGRLMRAHDWSATPLGPVSEWPQSLKTAVRIILGSRYPMFIWWGRELTNLYNDGYLPMLGQRHPAALGKSAAVIWSEIWDTIGPQTEAVLYEGRATWNEERLLVLERNGYPEEAYFTFSYSPIPADRGGIGGVFCALTEDTQRVIGQRRMRTLRELSARSMGARTVEQACQAAADTLAQNLHDLPFTLIYLLDGEGRAARLAGTTGLVEGSPACLPAINLIPSDHQPSACPLDRVAATGRAELVEGLEPRFGPLRCGVWPDPPQSAIVLPVMQSGQDRLAGFLVAGISPRRVFDDDYRGFTELLAGQIATAVTNARAYEEERCRAEALAELDRAKTTFFSNVSHEFRTPLTLILGPVEDALAAADGSLSSSQRERLQIAHRNGLRLQKLVNTLLDFSRIEAGRLQASYEPTDLATLTAELASNFRSACQMASLDLVVDCPPLPEPVYVDRDMWEKIVLNLLSNAFKYTLEGRIEVRLRPVDGHIELEVRDTGTGIPAEEMPRLFERFHRVEGSRGRTQEGSGIGLALVRELVRLHGGEVRADSRLGEGSVFTVALPSGRANLPANGIGGARTLAPTALGAAPYIGEALRWLPDSSGTSLVHSSATISLDRSDGARWRPACTPAERPSILLADDNADMRDYVRRLLVDRYDVKAVPNGDAALAAAREAMPDLILADVMMSGLDGLGLLRELRADPRTREVPVILLSARAGEDSRIEGLKSGADDYLVKPISARELLARVQSHLELAKLRREAQEALRESENRFRLAQSVARIGIFEWTIQTGVNTWTPELEAIYGLKPGEFGKTQPAWERLVHPDDLPGAVAKVEQAIQSGEVTEHEWRIVRPDGSVRWVAGRFQCFKDARGTPLRISGVNIDITDRKDAEEVQQRFAAIVENSDDAIISKDLNGVILSWNAGATRLFGYTAQEAIGRSVTMLMPPECVNEEPGILERIRHGERIDHYETIRRRKDGTLVDISLTVSPLTDERGTVVGASKITRDITDRKRAERALLEADRQKNEFLATLAHELRNPLAPIRNSLNILRLIRGDVPETERVRETMERQVNHLVRLVDDLLDIARISNGKMELRREPIEIASVIRSAVETSKPLIDAQRHQLSITLPHEPLTVEADPLRLSQVVTNLLNNASKYTEPGGQIWLTVCREADEVVISVRDTGIGICADMLPLVLEMFTRTERGKIHSQDGLGIGLALVKRLVELHGGRVEAKSEGEGRGSEFTVRLPVYANQLPAVYTGIAVESDRPTDARQRILVVDDNRDAASSLAMLLRILGNEVETAHNGRSAFQAFVEFRPSVVLLDLGMPDMSGYEVARRLRELPQFQPVKLVALTGWGQDDDRRKTHEAGFDDHMIKPVNVDALQVLLADVRSR
jgi:PAS domain S-box-containing protein